MAHWAARWAPVTPMQVSQRFQRSRRTTYLRLQIIRDNGLLIARDRGPTVPSLLYPTKKLVAAAMPALAVGKVANHLAVVQRVIELELDGQTLVSRGELADHPSLVALTPAFEQDPLVPDLFAATDPPVAVYAAMRGSEEDRRLVARLATATWPDDVAAELLIEAGGAAPADAPQRCRLVEIDLAAASQPGS
jgi:hypothetical protein